MESPVIQEVISIVVGALAVAALTLIESGRRLLIGWLERQAIIGAVQRAAGLALEQERAGAPDEAALDAALNYVHTAVPQALARQGVDPHLTQMVIGAIGVLRARKGG